MTRSAACLGEEEAVSCTFPVPSGNLVRLMLEKVFP